MNKQAISYVNVLLTYLTSPLFKLTEIEEFKQKSSEKIKSGNFTIVCQNVTGLNTKIDIFDAAAFLGEYNVTALSKQS